MLGSNFLSTGQVFAERPYKGLVTPTTYEDMNRWGNDGTIVGATWKRLPSGLWCLRFDGLNNLVHANGVASGGFFGGAFTMYGWGRLAGWAAGGCLIGNGRTDVVSYAQILYRGDGANKRFMTGIKVGADDNIVATADIYEDDDDWHFLAVTADADGHIKSFIVDDTDIGSDSTNDLDLSSHDKFYIGQLPYTTPNLNPFDGDIALIGVIDGELTVPTLFNIREQTRHLIGV